MELKSRGQERQLVVQIGELRSVNLKERGIFLIPIIPKWNIGPLEVS
jgi:hypothetical protein